MTTAIGITLLVGFVAGMFLGVPVGRFWERVRPSRKTDEKKKR
ncbi:MAG TPA: hypothetical protein RMH99_30055 [Sandaracinaceae bacterium LLY-WYZ-13_1]|nr:hypothetical protein [Sandaracinaceae bacterium LLY-WYZ-13_1]